MDAKRIAVLAGLVLAAGVARAGTIRVPEDYPSVLAGVDAAVAGDSVLVGPGTWTDKDTRTVTGVTVTACAFPKGGTTIIGTSGPDATVIDAGETGAGAVVGISYAGYPGSQLTLEGLTITGGGKGGAGIYAESSGLLVVRSCKVSGMGNLGTGHAIAVVALTSNQDLLMEDSEVSFNAGSTTPGIQSQSGRLEIYRSRFEGNGGIAVYLLGTTNQQDVTIQDCEFIANRGASTAAVGLIDPFSILIERNLFLRNTNTSGSSAAVNVADCFGPIRNNVFAFDSTLAGSGAAIYTNDYGGTVSENTFVGCHVEPPYGASAIRFGSGTSNVDFRNNIIAGCTGGGIATVQPGETPRMYCNGLWNNASLGDYIPDPTDRFLDPLFCDEINLDFSLAENSPYTAANSPTCGQVGAFGEGCGPVSVGDASWGSIKALYR